jgi:hypothetical protein
VNRDAVADPELAKHMPPPGVMDFLGRVFAALKK